MNSPYKLLHAAGIRCYPDSADVDHLRYTRQARRRANRFCTTQAALLHAASAQGILAGRLVCLDLVRPTDLKAALSASVYSLQGKACIEWKVSGEERTDRRALCAFTALELPRFASAPDAELTALEELLGSLPEYKSVPTEDRLIELERDLACWAVQRLPKALWAHVVGLRPMTPLARHQAAMADVSGVPIVALDEIAVARRAEAADMLDTAVSAGRKADTSWIVDMAVKVFSVSERETEAETLDRWGRELLALRAHVEQGDVPSAVVIAWQFDLVESGTLTKIDASPQTRARYARVASIRLWKMLSALPPDIQKWQADELSAGYLSMMSDPTCKDLSGLGAAISSFQAFAHEVFGIEPSRLGLHKLIPEPVPRAQWIPKSAIERAIRWLDEDTKGDPLLTKIVGLTILLGYSAPFRLSEVRWIRLSNIARTSDGALEIEITALSGSSRLKSPAATRRVLITDAAIVARIDAFVAQREDEGAPSESLLFAAPFDDMAPYRPHAVHLTLLRLLKQATGDAAMTFYALRHTVISNAVEELLSSSSTTNNNRLIQLADWAGHEVPVTTLKFYSHRFEFALRIQIDSSLRDHTLGNVAGERLLDVKANTLTVSARRRKLSLTEYLWQIAEQRAQVQAASTPSSAALLELHEPVAISFVGPLNRSFAIVNCFRTLDDLRMNRDRRLIQSRMHISAANLAAVDRAAVEVARTIYASRGLLLPGTLSSAQAVIEHFGFDFSRAGQARYSQFRKALALPQDAAVAADAAQVWAEAWDSGELSADPPERLVPLLTFLKSNEIGPESLLLTYEDDPSAPDEVKARLEAAKAVAAAVFHDHLPVKALDRVRRGRSRAFLVWPSRTDVGEAGRSNAGFDSLMFAASVWARPEVQDWK